MENKIEMINSNSNEAARMTDTLANMAVFNFGDAQIRTVTKDGEVWFVASDVCRVLELTNTTVALEKLDDDERSKFNLGRQGETNVINESGLYTLILGSKKPSAKQFKRWAA